MRKLPASIRLPRFHRVRPWVVIAGVALALLATVGRQRGVPAERPVIEDDNKRYHDRSFAVVKVVDGDTLDIDIADVMHDTTRIRLWGVDTPEVAGSPRGAMYWGDRASAFAHQALDGRRVRIELVEGPTRDKYKRLLAYVYVESTGDLFNEMLLRGGHAYADTRFPHPRSQRFVALEAEARDSGVGLWRDVSPKQMPAWRARRR